MCSVFVKAYPILYYLFYKTLTISGCSGCWRNS